MVWSGFGAPSAAAAESSWHLPLRCQASTRISPVHYWSLLPMVLKFWLTPFSFLAAVLNTGNYPNWDSFPGNFSCWKPKIALFGCHMGPITHQLTRKPVGSNMALTWRCAICEPRGFSLLAFACWHLNFLSIIAQESYFHCAIETKLSHRKYHKKHKNCTFLMVQHDYPDLRFCCGFYFSLFFFFQNWVLTLKHFFDKVTKLCQIFEICHGTSLFTRTSCKWCSPYFFKNAACLSISKYYSVSCGFVLFLSLLLSWALLQYPAGSWLTALAPVLGTPRDAPA